MFVVFWIWNTICKLLDLVWTNLNNNTCISKHLVLQIQKWVSMHIHIWKCTCFWICNTRVGATTLVLQIQQFTYISSTNICVHSSFWIYNTICKLLDTKSSSLQMILQIQTTTVDTHVCCCDTSVGCTCIANSKTRFGGFRMFWNSMNMHVV